MVEGDLSAYDIWYQKRERKDFREKRLELTSYRATGMYLLIMRKSDDCAKPLAWMLKRRYPRDHCPNKVLGKRLNDE